VPEIRLDTENAEKLAYTGLRGKLLHRLTLARPAAQPHTVSFWHFLYAVSHKFTVASVVNLG
jgi:hypothetical protein